jgi:transposase
MPQYSPAFKSRMLRRLVGPSAISANALAKEVGVHQPLLSRWLRESRNVESMGASKNRSGPARRSSASCSPRGLSERELGTLLRREGVHEAELTALQAAAEAALNDMGRRGARPTDAQRIQELEREMRRKDAAWPRPPRCGC